MTQIITSNSGGGGGAGAYTYKGTVNKYEDLPSTGLKIGDVYNVINEHTTDPKFPAGANVAWTGTEWDVLGGTIDLSSYQKKLVEGTGIDIDGDTNEISVDASIVSGAAAGATAVQPGDDVSDLNNDAGYITGIDSTDVTDALGYTPYNGATNPNGYIDKDVNDLTNYTKTSDLPDFTTYQLKSNMVTSLNSADDTHYPTAKAVKDAITGAGGGDVSGPSSSVDGHLAVFDGATGKIIKDGGAIPTPTTVVDDLSTQSATSALSANQGYVLKGYVDAINGKIPSEASSSNKLADKNYVDDSINQVAAYYITKNASGAAFATKAELLATTTFYSGGTVRTPTRNDYCIVLADETHNGETTRYSYQGSSWEYQYTVNETALTQQQVDALNSGITSTKVGQYDTAVSTIAGYGDIVTHNASEFATSAQGSKADSALQPNDNISELNNDAGYITGVNWGSVGGTLSNQVDLQNALNAKANDDAVVKLTGAQAIAGTKTFSTSPAVPSKTTDATNTGTAIATEAQVYKKQDKLTTQTAYTSKGTSTKVPQITTNSLGQVTGITEVDIQAGETYNAGEGIKIGTAQDYSAMKGPAPDGFHVPLNTEWQAVYNIWTALGGGSGDGTSFGATLKMPYAGWRKYSDANPGYSMSYAGYWSSTCIARDAYTCYFYSSYITPQYRNISRANGASIRCFKDITVIPTSSWTKLYGTSIESGGIFWNSADGLISLSSDGQTWITIMDKNLGATTVWNSGDILSEANCGKYYQWGNNYGFPFTGSVTTSSTQVDVSNYGPGNYYNSSTFITGSSDWSNPSNNNLRGGVTGVVTLNNAITNTGVLSVNGKTGNLSLYSTVIVTLTSAGWSSNSQTVSATGVTASNTVIVSPAPSDIGDYADCGVYCSAQGSGTLTFGCDTAPSGDIVVNVLIMS